MKSYSITERPDGTIEFWTDDGELKQRVRRMIKDIADAITYRNMLVERTRIIMDEDEE